MLRSLCFPGALASSNTMTLRLRSPTSLLRPLQRPIFFKSTASSPCFFRATYIVLSQSRKLHHKTPKMAAIVDTVKSTIAENFGGARYCPPYLWLSFTDPIQVILLQTPNTNFPSSTSRISLASPGSHWQSCTRHRWFRRHRLRLHPHAALPQHQQALHPLRLARSSRWRAGLNFRRTRP